MAKKWYNYFVSVEQPGQTGPEAAAPAAATPESAAETVADIASRVAATQPKMESAPSLANLNSFEEIYRAAEIPAPAHGYTIFKVTEMLNSEHIRSLPPEVKRSSVLVALDAAGVKVREIVEDAVRRDKALDTFERLQQKQLQELEGRTEQENRRLQEELDRVTADYRVRLQASNDELKKEKDRFQGWLRRKHEEEQRIAVGVAPFVTENPITRGPAASPGPPRQSA